MSLKVLFYQLIQPLTHNETSKNTLLISVVIS